MNSVQIAGQVIKINHLKDKIFSVVLNCLEEEIEINISSFDVEIQMNDYVIASGSLTTLTETHAGSRSIIELKSLDVKINSLQIVSTNQDKKMIVCENLNQKTDVEKQNIEQQTKEVLQEKIQEVGNISDVENVELDEKSSDEIQDDLEDVDIDLNDEIENSIMNFDEDTTKNNLGDPEFAAIIAREGDAVGPLTESSYNFDINDPYGPNSQW